jgi:hypothetical protein
MYTLKNQYLTVELDKKGRLSCLRNNKNEFASIIDTKAEGCFKMVFKKGLNWENVVYANNQEFIVKQNENSIEFIVEKMKVRNFIADISLNMTVSLKEENLVFDAEIINREDALITDFEYPNIGVIKTLGDHKPALLWPFESGQKFNNIGDYLSNMENSIQNSASSLSAHSLSMTYPGPGSMQWMALVGGGETLYFSSHDSDYYASELRVTGSGVNQGAITLVIDKMAFVKKGETWQCPTSVLKLYTGSWHHGAQDYMEWSKAFRPSHEKPQWIKDMMGYYLVIMKQQYGDEIWKYDDLPELYKHAVSNGCDTLGLFGWYDSGHDNQYPDLKVSETLGGAQMLKDNIKEVQKEGGNVTLYFQGHLIDVTTDFYKNGGSKLEGRSRSDTPYYEYYNKGHNSSFLKNYTNKLFATVCPTCPEWQDLMEEKAEWVATFEPNGVLYDQLGGMPAYPCFNETHPHAKGKPSLSISNGRMQLLDRIQKRSKQINKEFAFFSEHITDLYSAHLDCVHGINSYPSREGDRKDTENDSERIEIINYPELFRYCFSDVIITIRNTDPCINTRVANYAFTFGFRFEMELRYLADYEDIMNDTYSDLCGYAASVTALRKKYWDVIGYGRFEDVTPLINLQSAVIAKAYSCDDKIAVTLWNDSASESAFESQLAVPGYKLIEVSTVNKTEYVMPRILLPQQIAIALYEKI